MSPQSTTSEQAGEASKAAGEGSGQSLPLAMQPEVEVRPADFVELAPPKSAVPAASSLDHLLDVSVRVTAELGRVTMPISEILKLGIGTVVELDRPISEPVDLMVQGMRLARGEVVVVDDRFAIRIVEIVDPKKRATS